MCGWIKVVFGREEELDVELDVDLDIDLDVWSY